MSNNKNKVIFIIPSLDPGGIETYTLRFLRYSKDNIEPYIIIRSKNKGALHEDYLKETKNLYFIPLGYLNVHSLLKYFKIFRALKPIAVVDFNANFAGLTIFLAKVARIKKRIAFYRQGKNHYKKGLIKNSYNLFVNKLVFNFATSILANSQAATAFFFPYRKSNDLRFDVIANGVNITDYNFEETKESIQTDLNIPKEKFIIGHVGRLDPAKNHSTILKVAKKLIKKNKGVHFVFCGIGTENIYPLAKELKIEEYITILGFRRDVPRVLKALDLFFFPSLTEGQPNALIEAMVSDVEIISSNIPPIMECVPESKHCNLYNPNDVNGFEKAICIILEQNEHKKTSIKDEVKLKFDSSTNFKLFLNKII
jgi:glycosyltransferase involved in cell wall biosynthesis